MSFLKTIYYQNPHDYTEKRLSELKIKFEDSIREISNRYRLPIT